MCSDKIGDNDDSLQCDLCNMKNHTRFLNIGAVQKLKLRKTPFFGVFSETLTKSFSIPFSKKTTKKLKTFREVSQLFDQSENSVSYYLINLKTQ